MSHPAESTASPARSGLFSHRSFAFYWFSRTASVAAYMMQTVGIGWQIYELTGSAFDLGLVGLVQFVPFVALSLIIGQTADRYDRRVVVRTCQSIKCVVALAFAVGTFYGWLTRDLILALLFITGTARAFENPSLLTMVPGIVPPELLPRAVAASATANQSAIICGPALGGLIYSFSPTALYVICAASFLIASIMIGMVGMHQIQDRKPVTLETMLAGFSYVWSRPIVFGAISMDLFVVMFGGVTALLPIFARDILQTGPWGLGLLRSAPAIGALAVSIVLARFSLDRRVGPILFISTAAFGLAVIAFGLSTSLIVSIVALAVYGASDAVSVVIRHSLVQLRTPNDLLGRVMAINSMFTGTSSTMGEFRAGAVAAAVGAVGSVVLGGVGALLVAVLWMRLFPDLIRVDAMQQDKT